MSEWTSDDRRNLLQKMERIATVLEERLPLLSECNENEMLRARAAESDRRFLEEQRMRMSAQRHAAELIAERDKLLSRANDVLMAFKYNGRNTSRFDDAIVRLPEIIEPNG